MRERGKEKVRGKESKACGERRDRIRWEEGERWFRRVENREKSKRVRYDVLHNFIIITLRSLW